LLLSWYMMNERITNEEIKLQFIIVLVTLYNSLARLISNNSRSVFLNSAKLEICLDLLVMFKCCFPYVLVDILIDCYSVCLKEWLWNNLIYIRLIWINRQQFCRKVLLWKHERVIH
jgi:hypothetical protein